MRWASHLVRVGEMRSASIAFIDKPEEKRSLGRSRHRWQDVIIYHWEIWWEDVDWIHLVQNRDHGEHGNEPSGPIKGGEFLV